MNLKRIETFIVVATLRSFRKAAEKQFTTQPAISSRIASLEKELGVVLFDRNASPVSLTAKGRELLPIAEQLLLTAKHFQQKVDNNSLYTGTLRLGISETVVHTWLTQFLVAFNDKFPRLDIDITVDVTSNLRHSLLDRTLDLAFLMGPISEPAVQNIPLCRYPLTWVAAPSLVKSLLSSPAISRPLSLAILSQRPIITYARNTQPFGEISAQFSQYNTTGVRYFTSSSLSACLRMTKDGLGIASLPTLLAEPEIEAGHLTRLDCEWQPSPLGFTASYLRVPMNGAIEYAAHLAAEIASPEDQSTLHP